MLTEKVTLLQGLTYEGKQYKSLVLRSPIIEDTILAEQESEGKGMLYLALSLLSKMIVEFGSIPKEKIDVDLLIKLQEEDFERLQTVREYLKKKAHWSSAD